MYICYVQIQDLKPCSWQARIRSRSPSFHCFRSRAWNESTLSNEPGDVLPRHLFLLFCFVLLCIASVDPVVEYGLLTKLWHTDFFFAFRGYPLAALFTLYIIYRCLRLVFIRAAIYRGLLVLRLCNSYAKQLEMFLLNGKKLG